ncbi:MAG: hypothetical protein IJI68_08695 [Eggerthellaceae bacterium]|nr:hypothetical protein [Eggerthellaceae bacterium]
MEIQVDVERLREHLLDEYGSAVFSGFPAAVLDAWEIEDMDGYELCRKAEKLGIDLRKFQAW